MSGLIEFFYLALIIGQALGWTILYPRTEQSTDLWWEACLYPGGRNA
jgi:hypothetical protein